MEKNTRYVIADWNGEYIHYTDSYDECICWLKSDPMYAIGEWNDEQQCYLF